MTTVRTLYRSTLVAAALAAGTLGAAAAAEAHEQGWRGHGERAWAGAPAARWHRHGERERDGYRYGPAGRRYGAEVRDCEVAPFAARYYPVPAARPWPAALVVEVPAPY